MQFAAAVAVRARTHDLATGRVCELELSEPGSPDALEARRDMEEARRELLEALRVMREAEA